MPVPAGAGERPFRAFGPPADGYGSAVPGEVGQDEAEVYEEVRPEVEAAFTGRATYALTVVTTVAVDGERSGCLAGFVTQCSIEPPRFLVCISKVNHTGGVVARAQALAVHLLARRAATESTSSARSPGTAVPSGSRCWTTARHGWWSASSAATTSATTWPC